MDQREGLLAHEVPLRQDLSMTSELLLRLGMPPERKPVEEACCCIVANALSAYWQGDSDWVFYSRDNSHFAAFRHGAPAWYTRSNMTAAVDQLLAAGYLEERRTAPSPCARHRSRFRASPQLIEAIGPADNSNLRYRKTPPVILRCRQDRRLLDPREVLEEPAMAELGQIALDVEEHNTFLTGFEVAFDKDVAQVLPTGFLKIDELHLNPQMRTYYRVFNGDLQHGGRWYGPFWQSVPSAIRSRLYINGEPTIELDYAAIQLRLMFAHLGLRDPLEGQIRAAEPTFDLYAMPGLPRDLVKLALLIAINAKSSRSACKALTAKLINVPKAIRRREAEQILGAVQRHFDVLNSLWCSGMGLRLQRTDSDMCAMVHRNLRTRDLPVLSVHDSFICWKRAEPQLRSCPSSNALRQS